MVCKRVKELQYGLQFFFCAKIGGGTSSADKTLKDVLLKFRSSLFKWVRIFKAEP